MWSIILMNIINLIANIGGKNDLFFIIYRIICILDLIICLILMSK